MSEIPIEDVEYKVKKNAAESFELDCMTRSDGDSLVLFKGNTEKIS